MRKIVFYISFSILFVAVSNSCSKDSGDGGGSGGGGGGGGNTACSGTPGALFTAVKNIVQTNCATSGCHAGTSPQNGINFADNCTIVAQKDRIKLRAVDQAGTSNQMPPPPLPALTVAERQAISNWITAGGRVTD
jgi:uncharacterized membrane protein